MLDIRYSVQFKKDFKLMKKRGLPLQELKDVIELLAAEKTLDEKFYDHALKGKYNSFRECHIRPDWLLIYMIDHEELILTAQRTGSHSDLFE